MPTASEKQISSVLTRFAERGIKSACVKEIVTGIYGESVDETTRDKALIPFIDEVLRKMAGDERVGFEVRRGQKKWYSVPRFREIRDTKALSMPRVSVQEITAE